MSSRLAGDYNYTRFTCVTDNTSLFFMIMKCISFQETGVIRITPKGLKLIVDEAKCLQACALLPKELFSDFKLQTPASSDDILFGASLSRFVDCFNVLGTAGRRGRLLDSSIASVTRGPHGVNTSVASANGSITFNPRGLFVPFRINSQLRFHYSDEDSLFGFTLGEENNMVTECEMRTFEVDGDSFGSLIDIKENHVARAHFRADTIRHLFEDFELGIAEESVDVFDWRADSLLVSLTARADAGPPPFSVTEHFVRDECDGLLDFQSPSDGVRATYSARLLARAAQAAAASQNMGLKLYPSGALCLTFKIIDSMQHAGYIDFHVAPLADSVD